MRVVGHMSSISCWTAFVTDFGGQSARPAVQSGDTQDAAHAHTRLAFQWQQTTVRGWPSRQAMRLHSHQRTPQGRTLQ